MIFASDLDRTLIYSKVFLTDDLTNIVVAEKKNNVNLSHISQKAIDLLTSINNKILFIPVTARSLEQYKRIELFNTIIPSYSIIANGGIILQDNKVDPYWNKIIENKLKHCTELKKIAELFNSFLSSDMVNSYRYCEALFIHAILEDPNIDKELLQELIQLGENNNYAVSKQGRKLYIVPKCINKWDPLEYIMKKENDYSLIAAGDSLLDLPMLENCNHGIIPIHGELYNSYFNLLEKHTNLKFTTLQGIPAGEEILSKVAKLIS